MISDGCTAVLTSDVEILQLLLVVRDGQMEHQQLLGVALSSAVHQRAGEVVVVPADVGGGLAGSAGGGGGGGDPPFLPAGGSGGARAVVSGGGEVPGASHCHITILKY